MILTASQTPQRFARDFDCLTNVMLQVTGPGTIILSTSQGEAATPGDGIQLIQQPTVNFPWELRWQGEMWYVTDTPGQQFVLLILGRA